MPLVVGCFRYRLAAGGGGSRLTAGGLALAASWSCPLDQVKKSQESLKGGVPPRPHKKIVVC